MEKRFLVSEKPAQQEPVAWRWRMSDVHPDIWNHSKVAHPAALRKEPLYTAQRTWVGLTDEEIEYEIHQANIDFYNVEWHDFVKFAQAIEAKLKEKNT